MAPGPIRVGVLALQGDFREHVAMVSALGAEPVEIRLASDLEGIDALIIPGGESTTIGKMATRYGLIEPLRDLVNSGLPTLGTCAGMIVLSSATTGSDQQLLGVLDVVVERNAFGRQVASFEDDITIDGLDEPMRAVYIRAPWIGKGGAGVEVLAETQGHPVVVRQNNIIATSFHPELTTDSRIHRMLLDLVEEA
ncbi:MAG: pyridoxal 5'-phosphate synthase glutaminase subunit PdxT [Acidimicrobiia bacterium]|nr:pyridoxal 5'-phosphate synthase glutaminase subunit PdxT [Acidimicrobiia bacterium]